MPRKGWTERDSLTWGDTAREKLIPAQGGRRHTLAHGWAAARLCFAAGAFLQ